MYAKKNFSDGWNCGGGILFLIYLGKVSLSGEVGGYPQALLKVVNLQGMLDFHRNFHLMKRVKIVVCLRGCSKACMQWYDQNSSENIRMAAQAIKKSDIVYPSSGMSQSCQLTVVISAITSYHQRNCDQRYKSNELGQHPKVANGILPCRSNNLYEIPG